MRVDAVEEHLFSFETKASAQVRLIVSDGDISHFLCSERFVRKNEPVCFHLKKQGLLLTEEKCISHKDRGLLVNEISASKQK